MADTDQISQQTVQHLHEVGTKAAQKKFDDERKKPDAKITDLQEKMSKEASRLGRRNWLTYGAIGVVGAAALAIAFPVLATASIGPVLAIAGAAMGAALGDQMGKLFGNSDERKKLKQDLKAARNDLRDHDKGITETRAADMWAAYQSAVEKEAKNIFPDDRGVNVGLKAFYEAAPKSVQITNPHGKELSFSIDEKASDRASFIEGNIKGLEQREAARAEEARRREKARDRSAEITAMARADSGEQPPRIAEMDADGVLPKPQLANPDISQADRVRERRDAPASPEAATPA